MDVGLCGPTAVLGSLEPKVPSHCAQSPWRVLCANSFRRLEGDRSCSRGEASGLDCGKFLCFVFRFIFLDRGKWAHSLHIIL